MTRQRIAGVIALLTLVAVLIGMPWLLVWVATQVAVRFDLSTIDGLWGALTSRDDGTLAIWVFVIIGGVSWAILTFAILIEIISRLRHLPVPQLRGFGLPQAIARGLVTAAVGAVLASSAVTERPVASAPPGPVEVDTRDATHLLPSTPQAHPDHDTYVVKRGDTLWDIAEDELGDPYDYPKIFKASRRTVQPDGRRLSDPDLIYPGWKLTIPTEQPDKPADPDPNNTAPEVDGNGAVTGTPSATIPTSAAPSTTPSLTPATTAAQATPVQEIEEPEGTDEAAPLPWMLAGFAGSGALLAGGLWLRLRRRRTVQFRYRRPGRTITVPTEPALAAVEKTWMHQGDLTADLVQRVNATTQSLAAHLCASDQPIPRLIGIDVTPDHLTFRFADPTDLPAPWTSGPDRREWRVPNDADSELIQPWDEEHEPVWPTLVTLGQDEHGWRMINLETLGVIHLTGDPVNAEDLLRYWITELAVAPWARDLEIAREGLFEELTSLIPSRFWAYQGTDVLGGLVEAAAKHEEWLTEYSSSGVDHARAAQLGPELWIPRILTTATAEDRLDELVEYVNNRPGRTGVTVVRLTDDATETGTEIRLTAAGRVLVPSLGLNLVANGITKDEAEGCAAIMAVADVTDEDQPMPDAAEPVADWQAHADAAGHLHADLTIPRTTVFGSAEASSLLPDPDVVYVTEAATTADDLAELAPLVPVETTKLVKESDPELDQDLADWRADSTDRPRISVLGPVRLRLGRGGQATAGLKRVPYYTEIVAYLATRLHGATVEQLSEALGIGAERVRRDLAIVRARLGTNPRTGRPYLPGANDNDEAIARGTGVYLVEDLLCDADLFRRLRLRGEAAGSAGINDLADALRLVTGEPYDQLRRRGGLWLGHTHDDHHLTAAIMDVAHILTTHALATGDVQQARAATEIAQAVAPDDPTPHLDLARIADHEGRPDEAARIAREVANWTDHNGFGPLDTGERTNAILRAHKWLQSRDGTG